MPLTATTLPATAASPPIAAAAPPADTLTTEPTPLDVHMKNVIGKMLRNGLIFLLFL